MGVGKKFFNAFAAQVGRDTGRAVSNSIYGDAHSIPIRKVGISNRFTDTYNNEISESEARIILDKEGFKPKSLKSNTTIIIWFLLSFILFGIGPIIHYCNGISKLTRKTTTYKKTINRANYVQDRRYRSGQRLSGYTPEDIKIKMTATEDEKKKYKDRGILQIALGTIQLIILLSLKYYSH